MQGQIIKISSNRHIVESNGKKYNTIPRGKFRKEKIVPKVGDYVLFDEKKLVIEEILERKNTFDRPMVSNIDQAFIVTSLVNPNFSLGLLDRLITLMELHNVKSIICLTKTDLINSLEYEKINDLMVYYNNIGYDVVNNLETAEISLALGRGKHTTRNVSLYPFLGGKVLDTPGFSALDFSNYTKDEIKGAFRDFASYKCPFKDCSHTKEKECVVKKAVLDKKILRSRYDSYLKFYEEAKK